MIITPRQTGTETMCTICDKTATGPVDIDDVCDVAFNRAVEVSTVPIAALPALTERGEFEECATCGDRFRQTGPHMGRGMYCDRCGDPET